MKKLFFLAIVYTFSTHGFSQKNIWLKAFFDASTQPIYTITLRQQDTARNLIGRQENRNFNYLLSAAFEESDRIFWEIGFRAQGSNQDAVYFDNEIDPLLPTLVSVGDFEFRDFTIHVSRNKKRFETQNGQTNWRYFWGTAVEMKHRRSEMISTDSRFWSGERSFAGGSLSLVPRIQRSGGKRLMLELAPHFSVLDFGFESQFVGNPALSTAQQRANTFEFSLFETIGIRFGMAFRLNKIKKEGPERVD